MTFPPENSKSKKVESESIRPVKFCMDPSAARGLRIWLPILCVLFFAFGAKHVVSFLFQEGYGPVEVYFLPAGYEAWWHALNSLILFGFGAFSARMAVRVLRHGSANDNCLILDRDGLTRISWGRRVRWSWRELTQVQISSTKKSRHKFIELPVSGPVDWRARLGLRAGTRVSSDRLVTRIGDGYDSPLEEIAAAINEFRARPSNKR